MSVNALATLLEAVFIIFFTHTDMKALFYSCCACMCAVMNTLQTCSLTRRTKF